MSTAWPSSYPFSPTRKINDVDWDLVVNNITGSQIKSGSLTINTLPGVIGLNVAGVTNLNIVNITGSLNTNLISSGSIFGNFSGSFSGSITPFALPASYVIFSGSLPGIIGPYYAINGLNNNIDFSGTNASIVIQNTINTLINGGFIHFKSGTYLISSQITLKSNLTLEGEPWQATQFNGASGITVFKAVGLSRITLRDFVISGGAIGIDLDSCVRVNIDDVWCSGQTTYNCLIEKNGTTASQIHIYNSEFTDGVVGLYVFGQVDFVEVASCKIVANSTYGLKLDSNTSGGGRYSIHDINAQNPGASADYYFVNTFNVRGSDLFSEGGAVNGILVSTGTDISLNHCEVVGATHEGIYYSLATRSHIYNCNVRDNGTAATNIYAGIRLDACTNCQVEDNVSISTGAIQQKYGIQESGTTVSSLIIGNDTRGNGAGINIISSSTIVGGNFV